MVVARRIIAEARRVGRCIVVWVGGGLMWGMGLGGG